MNLKLPPEFRWRFGLLSYHAQFRVWYWGLYTCLKKEEILELSEIKLVIDGSKFNN